MSGRPGSSPGGCAAVIDLLVVLLMMSALYGGLILVRLVYSPSAFSLPSLNAVFSTLVTFVVAVLYLDGMLDGVGIDRGSGGDGPAGCRAAVATGAAARRIAACDRLRAVPYRLAVGRGRPAAKIFAGHCVPHASGLLAASRRVTAFSTNATSGTFAVRPDWFNAVIAPTSAHGTAQRTRCQFPLHRESYPAAACVLDP